MTYTPGCWFAQNVIGCGQCDGQLVRCHLIPKSWLKRELMNRTLLSMAPRKECEAAVKPVLWDERIWVLGCGGPTGIGGHHGMLDQSRKLRIAREVLPPELEEFAAEYGLEWWLDREYGPREQAA
jgi:hypothetical protein